MRVAAGIWAIIAGLAACHPANAATAGGPCQPTNLAALAGWNGVWAAEGFDAVEQGIGGHNGTADYKLIGLSAPWTDEGWGRMAAMLQRANAPTVKQRGWGFPMMMDSFSEFTFVISPVQTAIISQYRDIRTIYTDGRGHVPEDDAWPTNWGDSTGCWQGDTLVVDTLRVRFDPAFNIIAPPLSDKAHFVERLRLVAPGRLENIITITDPTFLKGPWTVRVTYKPAGIDRLVLDAGQDRFDSAAQTIAPPLKEEFAPLPLPKGATLTQAQLDRVAGHYSLIGAPVEFLFERQGDRLAFKPPGLDGYIPMIATDPLDFVPVAGGEIRFTTDTSGNVVGFEATQPDGTKASGKRKST